MTPHQLKVARATLIGLILSVGLVLASRAVVGGDGPAQGASDGSPAAPSASLREILAHPDVIPSHRHPLIGRPAPDFTLVDANGDSQTLRDMRDEQSLVLIFSYGLTCKNCGRQLSTLDRNLALVRELGARVAVISPDPPETTHECLSTSGGYGFPVLADPESRTALAYRACRGAEPRHATFIIDRAGVVCWANVGDAPFHRVPALITQLALLDGKLENRGP